MQSEPFLKQVAGYYLKSGYYNPGETCIVFPNKRAIVYFSKYLSEHTEVPVWAPGYRTINSLMEELSGLVYADRIFLVFEIYRMFKSITGSDESFDRFYPMTETILGDFDEIDKYIVNAKDLFSNLSSLRELEDNFSYLSEEQIKAINKFWKTFDPQKISGGQKSFLSFWATLPLLYEELRKSLFSAGLAYEGMAYRMTAEKILNGNGPEMPYKKYLFTGFNALNKCEEVLFRYLKSVGKADFFFDYDDYYTDNTLHEAGEFIRKNLKDFPQAVDFSHNNLAAGKNISFLPMSSDSGQAAALPSILSDMDVSGTNASSTAIVLADEKLLIPVLYALPGNFDEINVTMGYPVSGTSVFSLVSTLGRLSSGSVKSAGGKTLFSFNTVLSVLKNPLLKKIIPENDALMKMTGKSHPSFIDKEQIPDFEFRDLLFGNDEIHDNPCIYLFRIFDLIIKSLQNENDKNSVGPVNMAVLIEATGLATTMEKELRNSGIKAGAEIIFRLIKKVLAGRRIPFEGEPLAGLQVMGLLETRTLDFENIVILSMNEGIMPRSPYNNSFIPYSLRKGFNLPTSENYDAISAYYFYRLIQRAGNIFLLYNNSAGGLNTGERSRLLHQLYYEFPSRVTERSFIMNVMQSGTRQIRVEKNARVMHKLKSYFGNNAKVITPSAVNEYINCPLKFYFHYVAGLPKPVEKTESLDVRVFGNILHNCMSYLYGNTGPFELASATLADILRDERRINDALEKSFLENVFLTDKNKDNIPIKGINLLIFNIIKKYIIQLIKYDIALAPIKIISLEKEYVTDFTINTPQGNSAIRLGGIIDRVDSVNNITRILDYKTGKPKNTFSGIESLFNGNQNERNDAALQVFIYASVYSRLFPGTIIEPGLLFIQKSHSTDFSHILKCGSNWLNDYSLVKDEFEDALMNTLSGIFDPAIPFSQTENKRTCGFCHFAGICHR